MTRCLAIAFGLLLAAEGVVLADDARDALRLELSVAQAAWTAGEPVRLEATYTAARPVVVFHRILMGWAPDELELVVDGPAGTVVAQRVILAMPKVIPVTAADFVEVGPDRPLRFSFPLWGVGPLAPGAYRVVARYASTREAFELPGGVVKRAWARVVESGPARFEVVPAR